MSNDVMVVGDITLENRDGIVVVKRDGERIGEITAQGLHEAADLGDSRLSELWLEQQEDTG